MGERLTIETIERLRMWAFLGVVICAGLIIGLSNAVWSNSCPGGDILGLTIIGSFCGTTTGVNSHVVFDGIGDGQFTFILGIALLVTCVLAFAFPRSRGTLMVWTTLIGLAPLVIVGAAAFEYQDEGTLSQSLILMTAASILAPILSALFVWLDIKHEQATTNGGNQAWA